MELWLRQRLVNRLKLICRGFFPPSYVHLKVNLNCWKCIPVTSGSLSTEKSRKQWRKRSCSYSTRPRWQQPVWHSRPKLIFFVSDYSSVLEHLDFHLHWCGTLWTERSIYGVFALLALGNKYTNEIQPCILNNISAAKCPLTDVEPLTNILHFAFSRRTEQTTALTSRHLPPNAPLIINRRAEHLFQG